LVFFGVPLSVYIVATVQPINCSRRYHEVLINAVTNDGENTLTV